jgi:hypothetical protein
MASAPSGTVRLLSLKTCGFSRLQIAADLRRPHASDPIRVGNVGKFVGTKVWRRIQDSDSSQTHGAARRDAA